MKVAILIIYFAFIIGLGIYSWLKIKQPTDYFIAGKRSGFWQVSGSLLATVLGGSAILGTVNLTKDQSWAAAWYLVAASLGLWLLVPLVGKVNRLGKYTLTNLVGQFYGETARKTASVIIPIAWVGIVAAQIIASAKILFSFFNLPYETGVLLSGTVFILYTLIGGQISIIKTDLFQSFIILFGVILTAFLLWNAPEQVPAFSQSFPFNPQFSPIDLLILVLTFSSTFVVGPDIYSRVFCAKDEKTARKSVRIVAAVLLPFAFILAYIGVFAFSHLPKGQLEESAALIEIINLYLPDWIAGVMAAALLSAVLSSADTTLLTSSMILSELIHPDINNARSLKNTRFFILLCGIISILLALKVTSIIGTLLLALAFYSGAFIVPLVAALTNLKVNKRLSIWAMIIGGLVALSGKLAIGFWENNYGNWIIISAFAVNALILAIPENKQISANK
ncbi:sodium:solute symporter family protein [uncultured Sunxiuqinia sp.]|uniref:sodium:solute symporter family protein n=1 Tax=uncultured Sunxiuqinia sp. TaxID=1573825 RepID=UPI002617977D|nr:sodium:solute symporter family protein [uncultured Sunxiuqinia sp.]